MTSEFNISSYKDTFDCEIVGYGKNGTYDTVHMYINPSEKDNSIMVDELIGRKAETADWYKLFDFSEDGLLEAIKVYNSYVVSSDRINIEIIEKEVFKEVKIKLMDVLYGTSRELKFDFDEYTGVYMAFLGDLIFSYAPIEEEDLSGWQISDTDGELYHYDSWENKSDKEIADSVKRFEKLVKKYTNDHYKEIIDDFHKHTEV